MKRLAVAAGIAGGLLLLAGCSHSCVPYGWYKARSVPALQSPPDGPPLAHDTTYDIPGGGAAGGRPTRDEACLVQPPNALKAAAAASAAKAAAGGRRR